MRKDKRLQRRKKNFGTTFDLLESCLTFFLLAFIKISLITALFIFSAVHAFLFQLIYEQLKLGKNETLIGSYVFEKG